MKYEHAIVKFNSGAGALLCNGCRTIVSYGTVHRDIEHYCGKCYNKLKEEVAMLRMPRRMSVSITQKDTQEKNNG